MTGRGAARPPASPVRPIGGLAVRYLIDGYNLMFAGGLLGKRFGPDGFRKVRTRFLNDLAAALGPVDASQTVVIFDASAAPGDVPKKTNHKGIGVLFAVDDENADARIELLIAEHSAPKGLTVVSSDRRIRQAATRRRARSVSADDFWVTLDALKRKPRLTEAPVPATTVPKLSEAESVYWQNEFAGLDALPETQQALNDGPVMITDAEIAAIEREIEREGR